MSPVPATHRPDGRTDGRPDRRLDRGRDGRPVAPVRIVHLGLGNFFRAHAAWYTNRAPDASDWRLP